MKNMIGNTNNTYRRASTLQSAQYSYVGQARTMLLIITDLMNKIQMRNIVSRPRQRYTHTFLSQNKIHIKEIKLNNGNDCGGWLVNHHHGKDVPFQLDVALVRPHLENHHRSEDVPFQLEVALLRSLLVKHHHNEDALYLANHCHLYIEHVPLEHNVVLVRPHLTNRHQHSEYAPIWEIIFVIVRMSPINLMLHWYDLIWLISINIVRMPPSKQIIIVIVKLSPFSLRLLWYDLIQRIIIIIINIIIIVRTSSSCLMLLFYNIIQRIVLNIVKTSTLRPTLLSTMIQ